jgi:hypothetical protein
MPGVRISGAVPLLSLYASILQTCFHGGTPAYKKKKEQGCYCIDVTPIFPIAGQKFLQYF